MSNVDMQTIKDLGLTVRSPRLDPNVPMFDFAEVAAEKMGFPDRESFLEYIRNGRETDKKEADKALREKVAAGEYGDVAFAECEFFGAYKLSYEITPTGDYAHDYDLKMGLNYNMSCVDDKNWRDYDRLTAEEDFTGMSAAEIYKAIYEKYQHCYGKNFIDINAVPYVTTPGAFDSFQGLISKFNMEIRSACGSDADIKEIRREALYGDMSDYDVRAAIMEKYAADGFTNADLYKVTAEMDRCGVGGGIHTPLQFVLTSDRSKVLYNYVTYGITTSVETSCAMYEEMLASPVETYLIEGIERHGEGMNMMNPTLRAAYEQIRSTYGAYSGGISVDPISKSNNVKDDFVWIKI